MDSIKVSECMSRQFIQFDLKMPVVEAAMELIKNELMGGPVINAEKELIGWISEQDCIGVVSQVMYYSDRVATVADVMSADVNSVTMEANAMDVAELMKASKRKLFPVVNDDNKVVGVLARRHILRAMLERVASQG